MHRTAGTGTFCSSWRYRFLNFTHVAARAMGLLLLSAPLSFCILSLSPSLSQSSARSHIPAGGTPYCFIQRDQFLFHSTSLSFFLPLALSSLCLFTAYYMRFRTFQLCTHDCSHGQTSNPIHRERHEERSAEEGRTNPVKRRESRTMAEKKMRQ